MTTLEYNQSTLLIPDSWDEVDLATYQKIWRMSSETRKEMVGMVAALCGTSEQVLLSWPAEVFDIIVRKTAFIFTGELPQPSPKIKIEDIEYVIPIEDKLSLGEWVDAEDAQKEGERSISGILAVVCRPIGEKYEIDVEKTEARQALFESQPMTKIFPLMAFFLSCASASATRTEVFTQIDLLRDRLQEATQNLRKATGGTGSSRSLRGIIYYPLMRLLVGRLRRSLHSFSTGLTVNVRKKRRPILTKN